MATLRPPAEGTFLERAKESGRLLDVHLMTGELLQAARLVEFSKYAITVAAGEEHEILRFENAVVMLRPHRRE